MLLHDAGGSQRVETLERDPVFDQHLPFMFAQQRWRPLSRQPEADIRLGGSDVRFALGARNSHYAKFIIPS